MEKNTYLTDFRAGLEKLSMAELRQKASKVFGIKLTREHKADEIIKLIMGHLESSNYAETAEGELKPGYSRIKINRTEGRSNLVWINCNGYTCWIPVEIEVDVPSKVVNVLKQAEELKPAKNEFDETISVMSLSYPYNVIATCPGPDPKPGREKQTAEKWKPYQRFLKERGFWPSQKVLQQATAASMHFNMYQESGKEDSEDVNE